MTEQKTFDRPEGVAEDLLKSDITDRRLVSQWQRVEDVPLRVAEIARKFRLYEEDLRLDKMYVDVISALDSNDKKARRAAIKDRDYVIGLVLNMMRYESGLPFTDKPVSEWDRRDLEKCDTLHAFGNPATVNTARPKRRVAGAKNPLTNAEPGWMYRMVDANRDLVFRALVSKLWDPDTEAKGMSQDKIEKMENSPRRLDILGWIEGLRKPKATESKTIKNLD